MRIKKKKYNGLVSVSEKLADRVRALEDRVAFEKLSALGKEKGLTVGKVQGGTGFWFSCATEPDTETTYNIFIDNSSIINSLLLSDVNEDTAMEFIKTYEKKTTKKSKKKNK